MTLWEFSPPHPGSVDIPGEEERTIRSDKSVHLEGLFEFLQIRRSHGTHGQPEFFFDLSHQSKGRFNGDRIGLIKHGLGKREEFFEEFLGLAHWKETRLPVVVVRLFNTVGPRQTGQYGMVIPRFVCAALRNEPITVYGDGSQTRCFAHVADVVEGLSALLPSRRAHGEVINLGSEEEVTIINLAERIRRLARRESEIRYARFEDVYGDGFDRCCRWKVGH